MTLEHEPIIEVHKGMSKQDYFESLGYNFEEVEAILRLDRIYKSQINNMEDTHHVIAQSRGGSDKQVNRMKIRRGEHVTHHDKFGVLLPGEQVRAVLKFNEQVLYTEVGDQIRDILLESNKRKKLYRRGAFL